MGHRRATTQTGRMLFRLSRRSVATLDLILSLTSVRLDTPVRAGTPLKLFGGRDSNFRLSFYTPTSDDRFLVEQKLVSESDLTFSIVVVENWYEEFRDR